MNPSNNFRKITNSHVQLLLGVNKKRATRLLNKIRTKYGKTPTDDVRLPEFCEHERIDMDKVCAFFEWKN